MKYLVMFMLLFSGIVFAQAQEVKAKAPAESGNGKVDPAREATGPLVSKYGLNMEQTQKMQSIQARKLRNLADIETYKTSNAALYRAKLESIQKGTQNSIRRMLNTKEQQTIFQKTMAEQRKLRQAKREELSAQGASKDVIDAAVLGIYLE